MNFKKKPVERKIPPITNEIAVEIFDAFKVYGDAQSVFRSGLGFEPTHIKMVDEEGDRLFNEVLLLASGRKVIKEEVSHIDEKTGEKIIDSPKEYYVPTTKTDFKSQFSSPLASKVLVLKEAMAFMGYDYDTQWDEWLDSFKNTI